MLAAALALVPWTAQAQKVGVVTTAQGQVTVSRPASRPAAVKFREEVFVRDRIATGERSLARILFGDKAVVTVTEHAALTITDRPKTSVIDVGLGRLALTVARERMKRSEAIEIRTPHAVAAIRGTVVVVEVVRTPSTPDGYLTRLTLLKGAVDVQAIHPRSRAPIGPPTPLRTRETVMVDADGARAPRALSSAEAERIAASFRVPPRRGPMSAQATEGVTKEATAEHVREAMEHVARFSRERGGDGKPAKEKK